HGRVDPRRRGLVGVALDGGGEELGVAGLGRRAVDEEDKLVVAVVRDLQRRAGLDVHEAAWPDLDALGRLADVHRQRPRDRGERLLLHAGLATPTLRARLGPPGVGAGGRAAGRGDATG